MIIFPVNKSQITNSVQINIIKTLEQPGPLSSRKPVRHSYTAALKLYTMIAEPVSQNLSKKRQPLQKQI